MISLSNSQRASRHQRASTCGCDAQGTCGVAVHLQHEPVPFARELAEVHETASCRESMWSKTVELAQRGGGTAKLTISLGPGQPVEITVSVRQGRVSVVAHVSSHLAEVAVVDARDRIALALEEAGLTLQRLRVRCSTTSRATQRGASTRRRNVSRDPRQIEEEEEGT